MVKQRMKRMTEKIDMEIGNAVEIKRSQLNNEHGLCDSAEMHRAIYLIQLIEHGVTPQIHTAQVAGGGEICFIKKGEVLHNSGFGFGALSFIVISSSDPELQNMLFVEEDPAVYVGRPLESLAESLKINGFYEEYGSKWKTAISDFAKKKGINPGEITLVDLIRESIR